jgi:hypothetical protein
MPDNTEVSNSILKTVRQMIGPSASYDVFDLDLIISINAAFSRLCQLGVGPELPYKITGPENTWDEFMDDGYQEEIKEYVFLKVKTVFDTSTINSSVLNAYNERIKELEWELNDVAELGY